MTEENNSTTPPPAVDSVALQAKNDQLYGQLVDMKKQLESFTKLGDPESLRGRLEDYENLRKDKAITSKDDLDKLLQTKEQEIRQSLQSEFEGLKGTFEKTQSELRELKITDRVFSLAASQFNDDVHDDVKDYIRKYCDLNEDGQIIVKDAKGGIRHRDGKPAEKMDGADFVNWLATQKPSWAKAKGKSGDRVNGTMSTGGSGVGLTAEKYIAAGGKVEGTVAERGAAAMQILQKGVLRG
jgi:hypothetical protein